MRYSQHARARMVERGLSEAQVQAIVANPARGTYEPPHRDRREHYGFTEDRRPVNVVTNRAGTVVISVVLQ